MFKKKEDEKTGEEDGKAEGRRSRMIFGCGQGLYDEVGGPASAKVSMNGVARRRALREGMQEQS